MSKCPFWSTGRNRVSCNSDCPMNNVSEDGVGCLFKEHISESKIDFKDIIDYDYDVPKEDSFDIGFIEESTSF